MADDDAGVEKISDAWIFVSHSHLDLSAVRRIRDEFERMHANPLLFFLLALKEDEEVDGLIKREITARNFFLLCDSPNARASDWVQKERDFVRSLKDRRVHEIDLQWPWEEQRRVIRETLGEATSFLNYASSDLALVQPYIDLLVKNDFAVFNYRGDLRPGERWDTVLEGAIRRSLNGYFILFLTERWMASRWAMREFELYRALAQETGQGRLVVIALDAAVTRFAFAQGLAYLDFSRGERADHAEQLLRALHLRSHDGS